MKVEKISDKKTTEPVAAKVEHYYKFKKAPMVKIKGNFMGGGFNLSKNKLIAVLANLEELKKFAAGTYDDKINALADDEILKP